MYISQLIKESEQSYVRYVCDTLPSTSSELHITF